MYPYFTDKTGRDYSVGRGHRGAPIGSVGEVVSTLAGHRPPLSYIEIALRDAICGGDQSVE